MNVSAKLKEGLDNVDSVEPSRKVEWGGLWNTESSVCVCMHVCVWVGGCGVCGCGCTFLPSPACEFTLSGVSSESTLSSLPCLAPSNSSSLLYSPERTVLVKGSAKSLGDLPSVFRMPGSAPCCNRTGGGGGGREGKGEGDDALSAVVRRRECAC